mmetsp:Transcript_123521/g.349177  ORF Transcript_123521/g.349177 Transcript_123521/m.349177 type:complete len:524 (-) Transcript_123521:11-1582(-)
MPNLAACSDEEFRSVLPGCAKFSHGETADSKVNLAPLRAYEKAIRKQVDKGIIPGFCSMAIWRNRVLHVDASGWADLERRCPMSTDSLMRLYCMSKTLVAAGLMVLVERGKCTLEDDVTKFIPVFANVHVAVETSVEGDSVAKPPAVASKVTLRRLLTHCSGLGYGKEFNLPPEGPAEESYVGLVNDVEHRKVKTLTKFCERLAALPLLHPPGAEFEYSYGVDVVGRVIEIVSGQALDRFLDDALFRPLGMNDTSFSVPAAKLSRLAGLYGSYDTAGALSMTHGKPPPEVAWTLMRLDGRSPEESAWAEGNLGPVLSGGGLLGHNRGGIISTLNDFARFCLMITHGGQLPGGPRIFKEATVRDMVHHDWLSLHTCLGKPQTNDRGLPGVTSKGRFGWNALGELGVCDEPSQKDPNAFELGEYGYGGIAETFWSISPSRELIVLWFSQQVDNFSWTTPAANLWHASRKALQKLPRHKASNGDDGELDRPQHAKADTLSLDSKPRRRITGKRARPEDQLSTAGAA